MMWNETKISTNKLYLADLVLVNCRLLFGRSSSWNCLQFDVNMRLVVSYTREMYQTCFNHGNISDLIWTHQEKTK